MAPLRKLSTEEKKGLLQAPGGLVESAKKTKQEILPEGQIQAPASAFAAETSFDPRRRGGFGFLAPAPKPTPELPPTPTALTAGTQEEATQLINAEADSEFKTSIAPPTRVPTPPPFRKPALLPTPTAGLTPEEILKAREEDIKRGIVEPTTTEKILDITDTAEKVRADAAAAVEEARKRGGTITAFNQEAAEINRIANKQLSDLQDEQRDIQQEEQRIKAIKGETAKETTQAQKTANEIAISRRARINKIMQKDGNLDFASAAALADSQIRAFGAAPEKIKDFDTFQGLLQAGRITNDTAFDQARKISGGNIVEAEKILTQSGYSDRFIKEQREDYQINVRGMDPDLVGEQSKIKETANQITDVLAGKGDPLALEMAGIAESLKAQDPSGTMQEAFLRQVQAGANTSVIEKAVAGARLSQIESVKRQKAINIEQKVLSGQATAEEENAFFTAKARLKAVDLSAQDKFDLGLMTLDQQRNFLGRRQALEEVGLGAEERFKRGILTPAEEQAFVARERSLDQAKDSAEEAFLRGDFLGGVQALSTAKRPPLTREEQFEMGQLTPEETTNFFKDVARLALVEKGPLTTEDKFKLGVLSKDETSAYLKDIARLELATGGPLTLQQKQDLGVISASERGKLIQNIKDEATAKAKPAAEQSRFKDERAFRKEFEATQAVKDFKEIDNKFSVVESALVQAGIEKNLENIGGASAGSLIAVDQALITSFNKITDPDSVVRESEYARTAGDQALVSRITGKLSALLTGGAGLEDNERKAIVRMSRLFKEAAEKRFKNVETQFRTKAEKEGLDVGFVLGEETKAPTRLEELQSRASQEQLNQLGVKKKPRKGLDARDEVGFHPKIEEVASNIGVTGDELKKVIAIETARTFDPSIQNPIEGQSATGIIQFTEATAKGLGTTTEKIREMTATDQLNLAQKFLEPYKNRIKNEGDLYTAIFYPAALGKPDSFVLGKTPAQQKNIAKVNPAISQGKDKITVADIRRFVNNFNT